MNRWICCLLAALGCLFWVCERSDVVTGAGGNVVAGMDSTLTDTQRGFAFISVPGGEMADSVFSLPGAADPQFSTHLWGNVFVGVEHGDTLAGYVQFMARAAPSGSPLRMQEENCRLEGAYLYFHAINASNKPVPVYSCNTLEGDVDIDSSVNIRAVNRSDTGSFIGEVTLSGGKVDSIQIPDSIAQKAFKARVSKDTTILYAFAFSIVGYHEDVQVLRAPYVVMNIGKNKDIIRDTITGGSRFTAFEDMNVSGSRAAEPYSSHHTKRTAVFKMNVGRIIDSLKALNSLGNLNYELLNATIAVKHLPEGTKDCAGEDEDEDEGCSDFASVNVGGYKAVILDSPLTNEFPPVGGGANLNGLFAQAPSTRPTGPYNVHSIKAPLRSVIEKYSSGDTTASYIYVYLRPVANSSVILWDKQPPKIETIFTPSRLR